MTLALRSIDSLRQAILGLICCFAAAQAMAEAPCRIAFDMGSSGIRAGKTNSDETVQIEQDFLALLQPGNKLLDAVGPTVATFNELIAQGRFGTDCERVGGGFSAWRMALQHDPEQLPDMLADIRTASGVAILVLPQKQEGAYGYWGARQLLGKRLVTSHILDIGGGSLQISGAHSTYGDMLGQRFWHRELCRQVRGTESLPCRLQPMTDQELITARRLLADRLRDIPASLPAGISLTAISRPVTRGVLPALTNIDKETAGQEGFRLDAVSRAINLLAAKQIDETSSVTAIKAPYVTYLLSDLLLVEGVMTATRVNHLRVAEANLTNVPGLLADDRAYRWGNRYNCYLERLRSQGQAAYDSDPETCR